MNALYVLNIAAALLLSLWPWWFSRRRLYLPPLNPFTISLVIGLPVQLMKLFGGPLGLFEEGLFDLGYQYALLMGNVLVLAQTLGLLFFFRCFALLRAEKYLPLQNVVLRSRELDRGALVFLLIFLVAFYSLSSAEYGVLNWLRNPREGYQLYRSGQGHWYALAISALAVSMLLSFLGRPTARMLLWRAPLYFGLGYLLGSKGILLSIFTSLLTFLWFIQWKHFSKFLVGASPLLFGLLLWNLYLALSDGFDLQAIFEYFDYYKNGADYYRGILAGEISLYHGEITWSSLWAYVPRALWPDKPVVYGVTIINEIFYPGQAELTNTPAFGGAVEQFADFGVIGVLFFGVFSVQSLTIALFSYLTFKRPGLNFDRMTLAGVILLLVQFAPAFGTFIPGVLYLVLLGAVVILIGALRTRRRKKGDWSVSYARSTLHALRPTQSRRASS